MYLIAMYTVFHNFKNSCRLFGIVSLCFLCMACPGEENCDDIGSSIRIDGLIKLIPEKKVYKKSDTITLKLTIPVVNNYFGNQLNINNVIDGNSPKLTMIGFKQLSKDNRLEFISGNQGEFDNWLILDNDESEGNYKLEILIILDRIGFYSIVSDDYIIFNGKSDCNEYLIATNIEWSEYGIIEFTVEE